MPVPGPRTQQRPLPGYTNPDGQVPTRINRWGRPAPVALMGRTPGLSETQLQGHVLGLGVVRRMYRQAINYIPASPAFSWSENGYPGLHGARGFQVTRALRYLTHTSVNATSGVDNTRFAGLHTSVRPKVRSKRVTVGAGQVRTRPTVRNRMTSFGSRVPPINNPVTAAEEQQ